MLDTILGENLLTAKLASTSCRVHMVWRTVLVLGAHF